jgi:hypothetical protein
LHLFLEAHIRQKLQNAKVLAYSLGKNSKKNLLPKNKFKMAAKFTMATKTKFACENYKSSFFKKRKIRAVSVA